MIIKPFRIDVTPSQSKIVQEILFANGYCWGSGSTEVDSLFEKYLIFQSYAGQIKPRLRYTCDIDYDANKITFEEFMNTYDIKTIRKDKMNKIKQLVNEN